MARARKFIQYLVDGFNIAKAVLLAPNSVDSRPDRVCRRCWQSDLRKADAVYYHFEDAGACSRCGDMVAAADSVAVVSYR